MAIKGNKERALLRRGYHIQEALSRRVSLNENQFLRRNITETIEDTFNLSGLCEEEIERPKGNGIYCDLLNLLNSIPEDIVNETYNSMVIIYDFFKPIKKDNRIVFKKVMSSLLKSENSANSMKLVADFISRPTKKDKEIKKLLYTIRNNENVTEELLDLILKNVRFNEYSKYEESFSGNNFDLLRGRSILSHGQSKTFFEVVESIYNNDFSLDFIAEEIYKSILKTDLNDLVNKSDLNVKNDLKVGDDVVIKKGSNVEVKKIDYAVDSYLSEYFSIYKNSDIPEIANEPYFKEIYNNLIDSIFNKIKNNDGGLLEKVSGDISAMIFDKDIIILKDDIDFYWSNKGQRSCNELRLTIRYKVNKPNITTYVYDKEKHSNQLIPKPISLTVKPKVKC